MDVSRQLTEFALGGLAACGAGLFTNPLEVVKTRMQLQGELSARGRHAVHYRHVFHGFVAIAKHDGVLALQKGLIPALWYQFFMNGFRLGCYQCIENLGLTRASDGNVSFRRSVLAGGLSGCLGALVGSPIYMVKTRLQSRSAQAIAVGHQHDHYGMWQALREVHSRHGLRGLWRGASGALARVLVGSSAQLSTFTAAKQYIVAKKTFKEGSWLNALFASLVSGCVATTCMTPFDVVSTRLYNQRVDHATGTGMLYKGVADCFRKTYAAEGLWGFYKGWTASFFRLGPHTVLSLVFWDRLRYGYFELLGRGLTKTS